MSVFVLGLIGALAACSNQPEPKQESAAASQSIEQQAWTAIRGGAMLVDVRTRAEFEAGHLKGAINIPHDEIKSRVLEVGNDKDGAIVLYCRSGRRSGFAKQSLQDLGFTNVLNAGGYKSLNRSQ